MHKLITCGRCHLSFHMAVRSEYDFSQVSILLTLPSRSLLIFYLLLVMCSVWLNVKLENICMCEHEHGCMGHSVSLQLCERVCPQEHPRSPCCLSCHLAYLASLYPSCLSAVLPNLPTSTCLPAPTKQVSQIWQHSQHTVC